MNLLDYIDAPTLTWFILLTQTVFIVTCSGVLIGKLDETNARLERVIEALMVHHPLLVDKILRGVAEDLRSGKPLS